MQAKKEFKQIEERCTAKAETLEDLRDMGGKSFRTADLEKLMEKYDPEAYAQYSKFAKRADGARTQSGLGFLSRWIDGVQKGLKDGTISSGNTDNISRTNESGLSSKAQEFSVVFSSAELERMASDEKYAKEKLQSMETAVRMSEQINRQFGFERGFGKGGAAPAEITKIGIVFNDDGTTSFFAELEKSSAKQRERIEKAIEEKRTEKKKEEKKAEKEIQSYSKSNTDTKRTNVQADSMEELFEKMSKIDWNVVKSEKMPESGGKFDFSI